MSRSSVAGWRWVSVCCLLMAPQAVDADLSVEFALTTIGRDSGFPFFTARSLATTPDGFLWAGGFNGLARYDGNNYRIFNRENTPVLPDNAFVRMAVDSEGALWAGTTHHLLRFHRNQWSVFGEAEGWPSRLVKSFCFDKQGTIHASSYNRILRFDGTRFVDLPAPPVPLFPDTNVNCWFDSSGGLWAGWSHVGRGYFGRFSGGRWEPVLPGGRNLETRFTGMASATDGNLWVAETDRISKLDPVTLQVLSETPLGATLKGPVEILEDSRGYVWVGSFSGGLVVLTPDGRRFEATPADGFQPGVVFSILEDSEGSVWVASRSLHRFRYRAFRHYGVRNGLPDSRIACLLRLGSKQTLIGGVGLTLFEDGRFRPFAAKGEHWSASTIVLSLLLGADGELWAGTATDGLFRIEKGVARRVLPHSSSNGQINALHQDYYGRVWVGFERGVGRYERGVFQLLTTSELHDVAAFAEAGSSGLFLAAREGLHRLSGDRFERVAASEITSPVLSLAASRNTLWVGMRDNGLARLQNDRAFVYRASDGLQSGDVTMIFADGPWLYLGFDDDGVLRVRLDDLHRVADSVIGRLEVQLFTRDDGLGSNFQNWPGSPNWSWTSERILFARAEGLVEANLARLPAPPRPPPVHIESVVVQTPGQGEQVLAPTSRLKIADTAARIEIRSTVVTLASASKIRLQYRLGGEKTGWVDLRSLRNVSFSSLPPGDYQFEIRAAIGRSGWGPPATLMFAIVGPIWRSAWLPLLLSLGLAAVSGVVVYQLQSGRIRRTTSELRQQEALAQQRLRAELLVELTSDLVCFARPSGELVYLNPAGHVLLGYESSSPPPFDLSLLISSEGNRKLQAAWAEAERAGHWATEAALRHRDGGEVPVALAVVFEKSGSGETILVALTARDMTEHRQLEQDLRRLSAHRASVLEEERKRISREIHDELGQQLTALKHGLAMMEPRSGEPSNRSVSNLMEQTDTAIQTLRRIAAELRPALLDHVGLCAAVEWLTADMAKKAGMRYSCTLPSEFKPSPELATTAFRIVQEALTNVVRHSAASRVDVRIEVSTRALMISVADNGRGLPASDVNDSGSLGLLGMRERAASLGGHVEVLSNRPAGTTVQALFPLVPSTQAVES